MIGCYRFYSGLVYAHHMFDGMCFSPFFPFQKHVRNGFEEETMGESCGRLQ